MKRNQFVQACLSAGAMFAIPMTGLANLGRKFREKLGFKVDAGKDRNEKSMSLLEGDVFDCKISGKDTDGDIYVFESRRVKEGGPEHHYHFEQDEWWYVLEGEFLIKIGDTVHKAKKGDSVFGPRMVPHSFAKVGAGEGRLLMFFQPAGKMEEFFTKLSQGAGKGLTEEQRNKMREDHGFKKVGPAITDFKNW